MSTAFWRVVKRANQAGIRGLWVTNDRGSTWTPAAHRGRGPGGSQWISYTEDDVRQAELICAALNAAEEMKS